MSPRLNIHLVLDDATTIWATAANTSLSARGTSEVVFGEGSPARPHVTLVMGEASGGALLLAELLAVILREQPRRPIALRLRRPVFQPDSGYVIADCAPSERLRVLRDRLVAHIVATGFIVPEGDALPWAPHLTLAKLPPGEADARRRVQTAVPVHTSLRARAIEVSHAGPRGTCIDSLLVMEFGAAEKIDAGRLDSGARCRCVNARADAAQPHQRLLADTGEFGEGGK